MLVNAHTVIVGQGLVLVPYEAHHVEKYHGWMQDPQLRQQTASEPLTLEEEYDLQKRWRTDDDKLTFILLLRELLPGPVSQQPLQKEIDAMVGDVNLFYNDHDEPAKAEVEVMLAEAVARGRGLGLEAVSLMMQYAAETLQTKIFSAKIGYDNHTSMRLFTEKLPFKEVSRSDFFEEVTLQCTMADDGEQLRGTWARYSKSEEHYVAPQDRGC